MLDPSLDDEQIRAVVADLGRADHRLGRAAEYVWNSITLGTGPAIISQGILQRWLWQDLPEEVPGDRDGWDQIARAGAALFDRLGASRYAEILRSETTAGVFDAWQRSTDGGGKAARAAMRASGIEPADLSDFAWGERLGAWELRSRHAVERALEAAIVDGRLDPGSRGWRTMAQAITAEVVDTGDPEGIGQSWRSLIVTERAEAWANLPYLPPDQNAERRALVKRLLAPPPTPDPAEIATTMEPLLWLVDLCIDGVALTAAHYLPPVRVREAVERFGWLDLQPYRTPPRSEAEVGNLELIRLTAREMGLVWRRGRKLTTTDAGRTILEDPASWWRSFTATLGGFHIYEHAVAEALAPLFLAGDTDDGDAIHGAAKKTLAAQSWQQDGEPVTAGGHAWMVWQTVHRWETWRIVETERDSDGHRPILSRTVAITPTGRLALDLWLHQRITGPRSRL